MTAVFRYFSPTTPGNASWDVDLGNQAVRLGELTGLVQCAELGTVGTGTVDIEDPTGSAGKDDDAILGYKQFYVRELEEDAGDQRLFTGYTGVRRYFRGKDSLRTGAARTISMDVQDENSILSFRVFNSSNLDLTSSFNRPAETDTQRITALLAVDFLSTVLFDDGFIVGAGVAMDANDYTGSRPQAVLEDCCQSSGNNGFVRYNEPTARLALHYRKNNSAIDPAAASISNVYADLGATVFFANDDWQLTRSPHRLAPSVILPYRGGIVNGSNATTAYKYGFRDVYYPSETLATSAAATARVARYLAEGSTEDDRLTGTVLIPAASVNAIKQGQWLNVKLSYLPGYEAFTKCRVLQRTVSQIEETSAYYTVRFELTPAILGVAQTAFGSAANSDVSVVATFPAAVTQGDLLVAVLIKRNVVGSPVTPAGWTLVADVETPAFDGGRLAMFWKIAGAGESSTVSIDCVDYKHLYILELQGVTTVTSTSLNNQGVATNLSIGPLASAGASLQIAGLASAIRDISYGGTMVGDAVNWTILGDSEVFASGPSYIVEYKIIGSGPIAATATTNQAQGWCAILINVS